MSEDITRYELPPAGITLLGYVARRLHKTKWLTSALSLISDDKFEEALARIAMYAAIASTSFGRAYYQPVFNATGEEVSEPDPATGALTWAKLEASSPHYLISYSATMLDGSVFSGREEIVGSVIGVRGIGMPAPSKFHFKSGNYTVDLAGLLTSELVLSLIGRTRIRAYGFLNFNDSAGNIGRLSIDRNQKIEIEINGKHAEPESA